LVARLSATDMFELFLDQEGHPDQSRFGQEAEGWPIEGSSISAARFEQPAAPGFT
jgi:hypothetical protein